ncbi:MAG: hypothetical protein ABIN96_08890 [Rubrivivax sp.]
MPATRLSHPARIASALLMISMSCIAQTPAASPAAALPKVIPANDPAQAAARASLPPSAASAPTQTLKRTVIEDDNVRIEETRLRGLPQRITVRNKSAGNSSYEILVGPKGSNPSSSDKGTSGQSAWSLFDF